MQEVEKFLCMSFFKYWPLGRESTAQKRAFNLQSFCNTPGAVRKERDCFCLYPSFNFVLLKGGVQVSRYSSCCLRTLIVISNASFSFCTSANVVELYSVGILL